MAPEKQLTPKKTKITAADMITMLIVDIPTPV